MRPLIAGLILALLLPAAARADEVRVAVAASFRAPAEELARRFEGRTGHGVLLSVGPTGALHAQVRAGAPFDVFLAADAWRPALLEAEGLSRWRVTYARGRLALIGAALDGPGAGEALLRSGRFQHLALADPETAPYGAAARQALRRLGVWERLEPRVVYAESVAQAYQFVQGGGAELGLVAAAQALARGEPCWLLPEALHDPIHHDAVLLRERPAARAFLAFVMSAEGQAVLAAGGFGVEPTALPPEATAEASAGASDWPAVRVTLLLASVSTAALLLLSAPLAWWLARGRSRLRTVVEALVALPLILPPTVLGFYLLVLLGPVGPVGAAWESMGGPRLVFSFWGLVVGSVIYSLPFVVQPLHNSFRAVDPALLEAAATLGAGRLDRFLSVVLPLSRPGILTAATLGFAHTVGEFGVVLMLGGSIPGETKVLSIAIFDHVEQLEYARAHTLAAGMLAFSFLALLVVYGLERRLGRVAP